MAEFPEFVITLAYSKTSPNFVTLAYTLGLKSLEKGYRTEIILLLDGVKVGQTGQAEDIDIGEPFLPVKDMMEVYFSQGGELRVCGSCWKWHKLSPDQLLPEARMISADDVIEHLMQARSSIQLN